MVLRPKQKRPKWDENSFEMIFIGYENGVEAYRCFDERIENGYNK